MIKFNYISAYDFDFNCKKIIKKILKAVNKEEKIKGKHYISFIIVDNQEIHKINLQYRNVDRPTDVISFAGIDDSIELPLEMGDIFISYDKVLEQANLYGHSVLREFAFLVTHGIFHLLGYDHMNTEDEKVMFAKQDTILEKVKIGRN